MTAPSIQQTFFPTLTCFGCGPANEQGLRLNSYPDADGSVRATFTPRPEHDNGLGYLNGGIVATVLDCHSAAAVVHEADRLGIPRIGDAPLQYVTAGLDVRYRRPSPLTEPAELVARIVEAGEDEMTVDVELHWQDKLRATGFATWKRWRPR